MSAPHYASPADWERASMLLEGQCQGAEILIADGKDPDGTFASYRDELRRVLASIATMGVTRPTTPTPATPLLSVLDQVHTALRQVDASDTTQPPTDATLDAVSAAVAAVENFARRARHTLPEFAAHRPSRFAARHGDMAQLVAGDR
jgi:hypothetical protein